MTAQRIIQHIFQQPELSRLSIVTLEGLVEEYPYFTAARLLLAQKNYEQYPNLHAPSVKKAQLYSNNPHYFFQFVTGELEKTAAFAPRPVQTDNQPVNRSWEPVAQAPAPLIPPPPPIPQVELKGDLPQLIREREEIRALIAAQEARDREAERAAALEEEIPAALEEETPAAEEEIRHTAEETTSSTATEEPVAAVETAEDIDLSEPEINVETEAVTEETPLAEEPVTEEEPAIEEEPVAAEPAPRQEPEQEEETGEPAVPVAELPVNQHTASAEDEEPIKIFPMDTPKEETTLTFQPLYTDDYFAYKRLKEPESAEQLNEKGMADMRSFTDWLKEMKQSFAKKADKDWYHQQLHRIYVDDEPEVSEAVEKMAMESITLNDDIVSETLAEIWARQHQYQTAIQIYQKLSLLNPNKSAYFAQKIQELQLAQAEAGKS